jgi:hypothetical protein
MAEAACQTIREKGGASAFSDLISESDTPEHLHCPGVTPFHLGKESRLVLLLNQNTADAAVAEIERQRQSNQPCPHNNNLRLHCAGPVNCAALH